MTSSAGAGCGWRKDDVGRSGNEPPSIRQLSYQRSRGGGRLPGDGSWLETSDLGKELGEALIPRLSRKRDTSFDLVRAYRRDLDAAVLAGLEFRRNRRRRLDELDIGFELLALDRVLGPHDG